MGASSATPLGHFRIARPALHSQPGSSRQGPVRGAATLEHSVGPGGSAGAQHTSPGSWRPWSTQPSAALPASLF